MIMMADRRPARCRVSREWLLTAMITKTFFTM
jgi:hypothetical protein